MDEPKPSPIAAKLARSAASAQANRLSAFTTLQLREPCQGGKCRWHHAEAVTLTETDRSAIAWIIAEAVMNSRCGQTRAKDLWLTAIEQDRKLLKSETRIIEVFIDDVFGLPGERKRSADHLIGHVGEWLWYLHLKELQEKHREIIDLDEPKFDVSESGADGLVIYQATSDQTTSFRLWETKKLTGKTELSATTRKAYLQLQDRGGQYLAKLTKPYSEKPDPIGSIGSQLVDLWFDSNPRAGVGVGVATDQIPPPKDCFTTMGIYFPGFAEAGQLEGLLFTFEDLWQLAVTVRKYLWTAL